MKLQYSLFPSPPREFGGSLSNGTRKLARPLQTKTPIHLVLKSNRQDLIKYGAAIKAQMQRQSIKNSVKIYHHSINSNHLHLLISFKHRGSYKKFIRAFTAAVAKLMGKSLWSLLPYTRIATWGREFRFLLDYISLNQLEAEGKILRHRERGDLRISEFIGLTGAFD